MPVQENQFAREDNQPFAPVTLKCLITMIKQLGQFARIRGSRSVFQTTSRIERDTRLRRIGNDEAHLRLFRQLQKGIKLRIRIQRPTDDVDARQAVYLLSFVQPLQINMIQAILCLQPVDHPMLNGLNNDHATIKFHLVIHLLNNPIDKRPQKIPFAKLDDTFGVNTFSRCLSIQFPHLFFHAPFDIFT